MLCGFSSLRTARELVHELLVDVEPAGRVDDEDVASLRAGLVEALFRHLDRVLRRAVEVDRDLNLLAELLELVDRGRALEVRGHERRRFPFLAEEQRELGRRGRLPRALQAGEKDDGRRTAGERELRASLAHDRGQLVVDDLDHLLPRRKALRHLDAGGTLLHARDEILDDLEVDVRLEEGEADLPHRLGKVLFGQRSMAPEVAEGRLQLVGKRVKHAGREV